MCVKKVKLLVFFFILVPRLVTAQPLDAAEIERLLNSANESYTAGKYEKAYDYINQALSPYQDSRTIPENIRMMAEAVYYARLTQISSSDDYTAYKQISASIRQYPQVVSDRISRKINKINSAHEQMLEKKRADALKQNRDRDWAFYDKQLEEHRKNVEEMTMSIRQGFATVGTSYAEQQEKARADTAVIRVILIIFTVILACGAVAVFAMFVMAEQRRRKQEEQFSLTLRVVAALKRDNQERLRLVSGGTLGVPAKPLAITVVSQKDTNHVPVLTAADVAEIKKLDEQFRVLGEKIDTWTVRHNNSRNVAELVYKLSRNLGVREETSVFYYYAGMVYDAGFLSVSQNILTTDHLTVEQRREIRGHVGTASDYFSFIPQRYMPVFLAAAEYHHENVDGSGYQQGIAENQIPDVARLIRAAESYLSLTNKRSYHAIMDKDAAVEELKRTPGIYDTEIIAALEEIV
jgi:HD-GYP domain-containing protein (c-di-GMP phosphodiesterase class II)